MSSGTTPDKKQDVEAEHPPQREKPNDGSPPFGWASAVESIDAAWTRLDGKLVFTVILAEAGVLVFWTLLNGFAIVSQAGDSRGVVIRAAFFAALLGPLALRLSRGMERAETKAGDPVSPKRQAITAGAIVFAIIVAIATKSVGLAYAKNLLNWLQNASVLFLVGGLRGLVTRLTLWLALLGASLAAAKGKHIHIDLTLRHVPEKARVPVAMFGWVAASVMCLTGAWGFLDQLIIGEYRVDRKVACETSNCPEKSPTTKLGEFAHHVRGDIFLLGRQASLDLRTIPHVVRGDSYAEYMSPAMWNTWLDEGGWEAWYSKEAMEGQRLSADRTEPKIPSIDIPGGTDDARGILVRDMNLVIPFGLVVLAIRFLLRALLALAGRVRVDPDAAHVPDDPEPEAELETTNTNEVAS